MARALFHIAGHPLERGRRGKCGVLAPYEIKIAGESRRERTEYGAGQGDCHPPRFLLNYTCFSLGVLCP
jgi:hypothetical protein